MAMNKKEQADFAALKRQVAINRALRWTDPVERDLPPPAAGSYDQVTQGWEFNEYSQTVSPMWSKSVSHGSGIYSNERRQSASQNARKLFTTEELALRALRAATELASAEKLAHIDARLAQLKTVTV